MQKKPKKIMIIAGSDSSAGAGIQADIKTASAHGVYASTVITSITSQNTLGVQSAYDLPVRVVKSQIDSVMSDLGADYVKIGMLSNCDIIQAVSDSLDKYPDVKIIADPVMVAKGGHKLIDEKAIEFLKAKILNKAYLITPNIPELGSLFRLKINSIDKLFNTSNKLKPDVSCKYILLKGGHLEQEDLCDLLYSVDEQKIIAKLESKKINSKNTHGTGCSYASAIASNLANGMDIISSVERAHKYIYQAIKTAPSNIGSGHGPINHFCCTSYQ